MTLALAISGLVLSLLSLLWQGYTWRRTGAVLRVKASGSFPVYGDRLGDHYVTVTVINDGRAPTTVMRWGISMDGQGNLIDFEPMPWSTSLPHRLEAGAEASFHVRADGLRHQRATTGVPTARWCPGWSRPETGGTWRRAAWTRCWPTELVLSRTRCWTAHAIGSGGPTTSPSSSPSERTARAKPSAGQQRPL